VGPGQAIGLFEVMFDQKSSYIYRSSKDEKVEYYFIRFFNWKELRGKVEEEQMTESYSSFSKYVVADFVNKIYFPLS